MVGYGVVGSPVTSPCLNASASGPSSTFAASSMTWFSGGGPNVRPGGCCSQRHSQAGQTFARALTPDADRDLMSAIAELDDPFARTALIILRGYRDPAWGTVGSRAGLRLGLGQPRQLAEDPARQARHGTHRPLDADTLAALDEWMQLRGPPARPAPSPAAAARPTSCSWNAVAGYPPTGFAEASTHAAAASGLHRPRRAATCT